MFEDSELSALFLEKGRALSKRWQQKTFTIAASGGALIGSSGRAHLDPIDVQSIEHCEVAIAGKTHFGLRIDIGLREKRVLAFDDREISVVQREAWRSAIAHGANIARKILLLCVSHRELTLEHDRERAASAEALRNHRVTNEILQQHVVKARNAEKVRRAVALRHVQRRLIAAQRPRDHGAFAQTVRAQCAEIMGTTKSFAITAQAMSAHCNRAAQTSVRRAAEHREATLELARAHAEELRAHRASAALEHAALQREASEAADVHASSVSEAAAGLERARAEHAAQLVEHAASVEDMQAALAARLAAKEQQHAVKHAAHAASEEAHLSTRELLAAAHAEHAAKLAASNDRVAASKEAQEALCSAHEAERAALSSASRVTIAELQEKLAASAETAQATRASTAEEAAQALMASRAAHAEEISEHRSESEAAVEQLALEYKAKLVRAKAVLRKRAAAKIKEKVGEVRSRTRSQWERSIINRLEQKDPWVAESSHAQAMLVIVRSDATRRQREAVRHSVAAIDALLTVTPEC